MYEKKLSHLIKRDGSVKDFDANKIVAAIAKAGKATGEFDEARAAQITEERVLPKLISLNLVTPHIEQVQDAVGVGDDVLVTAEEHQPQDHRQHHPQGGHGRRHQPGAEGADHGSSSRQ